MRTIFMLLFIVFIGSGFLLSEDIHMRQDLDAVRQQNTQLMEDIKRMQDQLSIVNTENTKLKDQIGLLAQSNMVLESQIQNLQRENLALKDQNAQLQSQLDQMIKLNPLAENLMKLLPQSLKLALFIPILPVSLIATLVIYRSRRLHNGSKNHHASVSRRNVTVRLTEQEMKEIIRMRRNQ